MSNARTTLKLTATAALWAALGFAVAILLAVTVPNLLGYRSLTVLTGSMEPTLMTGDMVISKWIKPEEAKAGDIVTFKDPQRHNELVTHRVRSVKVDATKVSIITKGDANDGVERWQSPRNGRISRTIYDIPKIGYVANWISGPLGKLLLIGIPAVLLGLYELVRIWRPEKEEDDHELIGGTHA